MTTTTARARWIELLLLFGAGPALLALVSRRLVSLAILAAGITCAIVLLRDRTFPRRQLWNITGARPDLARVLLRTALACAALAAVAAWRLPALFPLPRQRPIVWAAIMVLYPISAYAQEIIYRPFFFHRYGMLFRTSRARIAASAAFFGWAHVAVNNWVAVVLTAAVGALFAWTYDRTRSTFLAGLEHALYGDFVFTIGFGYLFYSPTRWLGA